MPCALLLHWRRISCCGPPSLPTALSCCTLADLRCLQVHGGKPVEDLPFVQGEPLPQCKARLPPAVTSAHKGSLQAGVPGNGSGVRPSMQCMSCSWMAGLPRCQLTLLAMMRRLPCRAPTEAGACPLLCREGKSGKVLRWRDALGPANLMASRQVGLSGRLETHTQVKQDLL